MTKGKQIIDYMSQKGYTVRALNLIGVEGVDTDFERNDDSFDVFNDVIAVISSTGFVSMAFKATTEPGAFYTDNRMNPDGAARMEFGQYTDAYQVGYHFDQYPALVQVRDVSVRRDDNQDGVRTNDKVYKGLFGINIHTTSDYPDGGYLPQYIGRWSAGCQVVQNSASFYDKLMPTVIGFGNDSITYTLISGVDVFG